MNCRFFWQAWVGTRDVVRLFISAKTVETQAQYPFEDESPFDSGLRVSRIYRAKG
jgi:hypothetical protein